MICFICCFPSLAHDYRLKDVYWDYSINDGTIVAKWEQLSNREEDVTKFKIKVYLNGSKIIMDWKTVSQTSFDVASLVDRFGEGRYIFAVYPEKETEAMKMVSASLTVNDAFLRNIQNTLDQRHNALDERYINGIDENGEYMPTGWISRPAGNYQYRDIDHKLVMDGFKEIDGITYYFSTQGLTLTGWQVIDQTWYCFDSEAALYKNTTTPDGFTVNEKGQWVEDGKVVKANEPISSDIDPKKVELIETLNINISERSSTQGELYQVNFTNPSYGKITEISYSTEPENWNPGEDVIITLTVHAYAGCSFFQSTYIKCSSKLALISSEISNREFTCKLAYTPGKQLPDITGFYTTDEFLLEWDDVPDAYYYEVTIYDDSSGSRLDSCKVYDSCCDFSNYTDVDNLKFKIVARAYNEKRRNIKYSSTYYLINLDQEQLNRKMIPGSLKHNEDGKLYYIDEYGERVKDRTVCLGGYYYTFDKTGYAAGPGWYSDEAGYKYYFDSQNRMTLGDATVDNKKQHFNAGELFDVPIGALVN